jgi:hypothetical protein
MYSSSRYIWKECGQLAAKKISKSARVARARAAGKASAAALLPAVVTLRGRSRFQSNDLAA